MLALMNMLGAIPLWGLLMLVAVLSTAISWVLVARVRRWFPHPHLKENNEFVGFTYAVYGLIYGVVLAFTIVTAWERFYGAESVVMREVTALSELSRDAGAFSPEARAEIRRDLKEYVSSAIDKEWKAMAEKGEADPATQSIYEHLWMGSYKINPTTRNQEAFLAEYLARINELSGQRRLRLTYCRTELSSILWIVLLAGAVPTVAYTLFFATKHGWVHVMVTSFLTGLIMLCLLVTFSLQYPFSGRVAVKSDSFEELKRAMELRESADATGSRK
jgi:hypothetical protein